MLTPAEAEKLIQAVLSPAGTEDCPLAEAHGRVLRREIRADRDLPPFDRVTMDGYALRSVALAEGRRTFRVIGVQAAGMIPRKLGAQDDVCIEIMTGAARPEGADCVVPYEDVTRAGDQITVAADVAKRTTAGSAIHRRGSDHEAADLIVPAVLFIALTPGVLLTIPPKSGGLFLSGQTSPMAVGAHTLVFAILFAYLRSAFPRAY